jgi:hypothetical protein
MLTDDAFLLYFAEDNLSLSLHAILSMSFQEWIASGELNLIRWTQDYGSVGYMVTEVVELKIIGLPCNLNAVPVIEYILSPFAFVKTHATVADDSPSGVGNTIAVYRCSVWCITTNGIPATLRLKVLPSHLTDTLQISSDAKCKCPILNISIHASSTLAGVFPL